MRYLQHADTSARLASDCEGSRRARLLRGPVRAGISLLEVTFSIGVVMIGLVGIAALLPVAGSQANKGAIADSAARRGVDAVREFHVRSMANPNTWRWFDQSISMFRPVAPGELADGLSFCIDPRFVAQGAANSDHAERNAFPYIDAGTVLSMPRITLSPSPWAAGNLVMGRLQADQIFTSDDELVFELPSDRTLGPLQSFSLAPTAPFAPLRRSINGYTSWMATVVPRLDRMGNLTDEYTLSIVVFSRRVIDAPVNNVNAVNVASERVVHVAIISGQPAFFSGQPAVGGGDLELVTRRNNEEDLRLRTGDWVMLSGTKLRPGLPTPIQVHKWYRVANAGEEAVFDAGNNNWVRDVTLIGPDWDWMSNISPTTQVTIVRGVVAVFEKTIRLETSSLWTY
ncbi:MAG: type IV pilus modification PilV family protein [Pirellulaceae bacterium]